MIAAIRVKDVGPLDANEKSGDIAYCFASPYTPGTQERKSFLMADIPDPINPQTGVVWHEGLLSQMREELVQPIYGPGPTPDENIIIKARRKGVLYWVNRFSPDELVILKDSAQVLPDGPTAFGGTVSGGVISGLFTHADVLNK